MKQSRNEYTGLRNRTPEQMRIDALMPRMQWTEEQKAYLKYASTGARAKFRATPEQSREWLTEWGRRIRES